MDKFLWFFSRTLLRNGISIWFNVATQEFGTLNSSNNYLRYDLIILDYKSSKIGDFTISEDKPEMKISQVYWFPSCSFKVGKELHKTLKFVTTVKHYSTTFLNFILFISQEYQWVHNNIQYWLLTMCQAVCAALKMHYLTYHCVVNTIITEEKTDWVKLNVQGYPRF